MTREEIKARIEDLEERRFYLSMIYIRPDQQSLGWLRLWKVPNQKTSKSW